ncbi:DUF533 domain-containing protein [Salipiger sp.]|uniref:DUF533 domain-containing protein n=1 Tax=Salipiger sp. TaxID=2078585 RepID=UPI003A9696AE
MGLMGTLAKVAIGYAAARGVDRMSGGQGLGGLLGGGAQVPGREAGTSVQAQFGKMMSGEGNPMQEMMTKFRETGLGGMFAGLGGAAGTEGAEGRKGGLLSSLTEPGGAGLAGMLAAAGGATAMGARGTGQMIDQFRTAETAPEAEKAAALMLRAMIQAAKSDGGIDAAEKAKILETVGDDADAADIAFIKEQLAAPVDAEALAADTPDAQKAQVYAASLMTIRLDTPAEAEYLDALAKAMELPETAVNTLHMQMGMQPLYS